MRDYNSIQFRGPKKSHKSSDHPLDDAADEKKEVNSKAGSSSTVATTASTLNRSASPQHSAKLSAADALAMRRDGAEATIIRLRNALEANAAQDLNIQTSLAKSEATVAELRSSVRTLKRQLEKIQDEKAAIEEESNVLHQKLRELQEGVAGDERSAHARDAELGELQVQLDRAHAQILTADMVRKELEDTLEAEQYTWELRVQDQERTIQELQQECATLAEDLEQCRKQWKDAEEGWTEEIQEIQIQLEKVQQEAAHWKAMQNDSREVKDLKEQIFALEQERSELQSCLKEALKELEAVDAELQLGNKDIAFEENERLRQIMHDREIQLMEPLQHLHRWLLERDGIENSVHAQPRDARELLAAIQSHVETLPANDMDLGSMRQQVIDLENQLSVYRGDLKAREESSAELRASLKEAVALLKPLQDAVARADQEKAQLLDEIDQLQSERRKTNEKMDSNDVKKLKKQLEMKDDEIDHLKQEIESLEIALSRAKLMVANQVVSAHNSASRSTPDSLSKAREELRARRASESALKQLLRDAQDKFSNLHQQNREVAAMNNELHGKLKKAEEQMFSSPSADSGTGGRGVEVDSSVQATELQGQMSALKSEVVQRDRLIKELEEDLERARKQMRESSPEEKSKLIAAQAAIRELEAKLAATRDELKAKKESERALNRTLKEALSLIKPLQRHLEESEQEKNALSQELKSLKRVVGGSPSFSRSAGKSSDVTEDSQIRELREVVRQLEKENSQLHNALEDMSQSMNNASHLSIASGLSQKTESKLREDIVELKSRYEVTQKRLEKAFSEKHSLSEELKKRDDEEREMADEIRILREKLKTSEAELENAKFIATSALVKVEEMTMSTVEQKTLNSKEHDRIYKEKSREVDRELNAVKQQRAKVPYRLT